MVKRSAANCLSSVPALICSKPGNYQYFRRQRIFNEINRLTVKRHALFFQVYVFIDIYIDDIFKIYGTDE